MTGPRFTPQPPAPLTMIALGAAIYVACAFGVNAWIVAQPRSNAALQIVLLVLLSLGLVTALEGLFRLLHIVPRAEPVGQPYSGACLASLAYSVTWGPYVFVNLWWHDDWGYLMWDRGLSWDLLTRTMNDHLSPVLNVIVWAATNVFGTNYLGLALLQHGAFVALLLAVAHLLWTASKDVRLLILFLVAYACWPSHEEARTFFAGGFWLSASAAFLMIYLLHAHTLLRAAKPLTLPALLLSGVLASLTVLVASQTMIPVVFLVLLAAPAIVVAPDRMGLVRRIAALAAISLLPTILILVGRSVYVHRAGFDLSGLLNGDLLRNIIFFFTLKVTLLPEIILTGPYRLYAVALFAALFAAPILLAIMLQLADVRRRRIADGSEWAARAGLVLLGTGLLAVLFIQIGAARSWGSGSVLTGYYATLPLLAIWIAEFAAAATLLPVIASRTRLLPRPGLASASVVAVVVVVAVALSVVALHREIPLQARIAQVEGQRLFLQRLGTAVCSLAGHQDRTWRPRYDSVTDCELCRSILGPPEFVESSRGFLSAIAPVAARHVCGEETASRVIVKPPADRPDPTTQGPTSSEVEAFYRTYFGPPSAGPAH